MIHQSKKNQILFKKFPQNFPRLTHQTIRKHTQDMIKLISPTHCSPPPSTPLKINNPEKKTIQTQTSKHFKPFKIHPLVSNKLLTQSKKCIKITVLKDQKEN
jgi:hypothetical protein